MTFWIDEEGRDLFSRGIVSSSTFCYLEQPDHVYPQAAIEEVRMPILRHFFEKFLADFLQVFKVLPRPLRHATLRVFCHIIVLACLEVSAILSISLLTVSIAAPEKLRDLAPVAAFFRVVPPMDELCAEPRGFALLISSIVVVLIAIKNGMSAFVGLTTARLGEEIALFAGETVFRHYLYSPYIVHLAGDSLRMFQALSWRTNLGNFVINLMTIYSYAVISIAMLVTLASATPQMILLIILSVVLASVLIYKSLKCSMDRADESAAECGRRENAATMNAMHGIREALIYRQQQVFFEAFRNACRDGIPDRTFLIASPPIPTWTLETVGFLVIPVTLWAMYTLQDASMARITGVLTMIMLISWRVLPMLNRSLSAFVSARGMRHAAMDCLARVENAIANPAPELPAPDLNFTLHEGIAFVDASFRYPGAQEDSLHNLNFYIPCGARVGIIGQSGAGKSSIAGMISGLVQPTAGAILADGRMLDPPALAAYTMCVGYVPQTSYIMPGTLAENVAFSQWGKPCDEEKVKKVCRMVALDIVQTRGITMRVGEKGSGISGGQAQRLSIARALYTNPSLLILDEATSSLDTGVETSIMNTIFSLPESITTVVIAHRLSTVERCSMLLWIDKGKLVGSGPPSVILPKYMQFLTAKEETKIF
ncbi:hypothetical protein AGMMS49925_11480 [Deltaproteobacteria bacterium]|nr:hypothetical protein AGMMS49925_11480 [Deltaproteobacteria bacterium]